MAGSIHTLFRSVAAIAAICFVVLWAEPAKAATVACSDFSPDITGFVTNTSDCQLPDHSDVDSPDQLNIDELFGVRHPISGIRPS